MNQPTDGLILDKLDQVLRILTVIATKGMAQREQIAILNQAGFPPKDIAGLLGTSGNTVRVELTRMRKSNNKNGRRPNSRSKK